MMDDKFRRENNVYMMKYSENK